MYATTLHWDIMGMVQAAGQTVYMSSITSSKAQGAPSLSCKLGHTEGVQERLVVVQCSSPSQVVLFCPEHLHLTSQKSRKHNKQGVLKVTPKDQSSLCLLHIHSFML